jgi:NADH dehydrogenase
VSGTGVAMETAGARQEVAARTVLWAAGVTASPLGAVVAGASGAELDRAGRVKVGPDLTVPAHPELFVIGDLAAATDAAGRQLPGVAPVAMQQGTSVARVLEARLEGRQVKPFRYRDKGGLAVIGRDAAIAELPFARLWGFPAWLFWLFLHLMYLVQFANRLLVFLQWALCYFSRNRFARLITGPSPLPLKVKSAQGAEGPPGDRERATAARR